MKKAEIRSISLKKRASLKDRELKDKIILEKLLTSDFYKSAKTVMTYVSYKSEVDTKELINILAKDKKRTCAPVCFSDGLMEAYEFSEISSLEQSKMGILEPKRLKKVLPDEIDLIIVPGCAFNEKGYRIGYGGGFYDRYLKNTNAVTCGLFYDGLKTDFNPDETDIPLDFIITEEKIYKFLER